MFRKCLRKGLLLISLFCGTNSQALPPGFYGTLGIIPGLGHIANGHFFEGIGWAAVSMGLMTIPNETAVYAGFNLWQYNMFDAYKDAGGKTSGDTVYVNYLANWNPLNIWDPIGGPIVGLGAYAGWPARYPSLMSTMKVIKYTFVGLGEESLFRGFLFPAFTSVFWDSRWMGAITSSLVFSAAHGISDPTALQPVPLAFRWAMGMLFCWQFARNSDDLKNNIFAHSWYDVLVTNNDIQSKKSANISTNQIPDFKLRFNMPIP